MAASAVDNIVKLTFLPKLNKNSQNPGSVFRFEGIDPDPYETCLSYRLCLTRSIRMLAVERINFKKDHPGYTGILTNKTNQEFLPGHRVFTVTNPAAAGHSKILSETGDMIVEDSYPRNKMCTMFLSITGTFQEKLGFLTSSDSKSVQRQEHIV